MLNNSLNAVTKYALNKINFSIKTKDPLAFINILVNEEQKRLHSYQWKEAEESITYTNLIIKKHHDIKYKSIKFKINNKVYLNLHQEYKLDKNDSHHKLEVQCTGSYKVLKQVNNLIYWLKLLETIWIHNVVLVTQLKPYPKADSYKKESRLNFDSVEKQDSNLYYKINTVIDKKMIYENS